jgi:hypothetical protein
VPPTNNNANQNENSPEQLKQETPQIESNGSVEPPSSYSSPSSQQLLNPQGNEASVQKRERIEQKYSQGNEIREVSDEYRGSNLSFPIDDQQRMATNSAVLNYAKPDKISKSEPTSEKNTSNKSLEQYHSHSQFKADNTQS